MELERNNYRSEEHEGEPSPPIENYIDNTQSRTSINSVHKGKISKKKDSIQNSSLKAIEKIGAPSSRIEEEPEPLVPVIKKEKKHGQIKILYK